MDGFSRWISYRGLSLGLAGQPVSAANIWLPLNFKNNETISDLSIVCLSALHTIYCTNG